MGIVFAGFHSNGWAFLPDRSSTQLDVTIDDTPAPPNERHEIGLSVSDPIAPLSNKDGDSPPTTLTLVWEADEYGDFAWSTAHYRLRQRRSARTIRFGYRFEEDDASQSRSFRVYPKWYPIGAWLVWVAVIGFAAAIRLWMAASPGEQFTIEEYPDVVTGGVLAVVIWIIGSLQSAVSKWRVADWGMPVFGVVHHPYRAIVAIAIIGAISVGVYWVLIGRNLTTLRNETPSPITIVRPGSSYEDVFIGSEKFNDTLLFRPDERQVRLLDGTSVANNPWYVLESVESNPGREWAVRCNPSVIRAYREHFGASLPNNHFRCEGADRLALRMAGGVGPLRTYLVKRGVATGAKQTGDGATDPGPPYGDGVLEFRGLKNLQDPLNALSQDKVTYSINAGRPFKQRIRIESKIESKIGPESDLFPSYWKSSLISRDGRAGPNFSPYRRNEPIVFEGWSVEPRAPRGNFDLICQFDDRFTGKASVELVPIHVQKQYKDITMNVRGVTFDSGDVNWHWHSSLEDASIWICIKEGQSGIVEEPIRWRDREGEYQSVGLLDLDTRVLRIKQTCYAELGSVRAAYKDTEIRNECDCTGTFKNVPARVLGRRDERRRDKRIPCRQFVICNGICKK